MIFAIAWLLAGLASPLLLGTWRKQTPHQEGK